MKLHQTARKAGKPRSSVATFRLKIMIKVAAMEMTVMTMKTIISKETSYA